MSETHHYDQQVPREAIDRAVGQPGRRSVLQMVGAAALAPALGSLAACGGSSGGGTSASGPLSLVYLGDATQQQAFTLLFKEFNKAHPDIKINARGIASGDWATFANTVSTQIAGGKVPDIVSVATEGQKLFASKGLLAPLDPYIAQDKPTVDAFYTGIDPHLKEWTTKYGSTDGKTYFIPGGYNPVVMYCNTEVFAKAGVALPTQSWTWEEFLAAGRQIKAKTGAYLLPIGYEFPFVDIMPWLLTNDASTLNADWDEATFDSPEAVEAATFVKGLLDAGLSPKPGGTFDAATQFQRGKLATLGGGRWPTLDLRRLKMVDKAQIVSWPTHKGPGSPIGWDGWPIMKASKQKDKAWTFLKWMMSKQASEFYARIGGTNVPALTSVGTSPVFLNNAPRGSQRLSEAIRYGTPIPSPDRGAEMQAAVTAGWQAAITGTKPVKDALEQANTKLAGLV